MTRPVQSRWKLTLPACGPSWALALAFMAMPLALLTGCDSQAGDASVGRVAVVDMARVAQATGLEQRLGQQFQQAQQQEQARLEALQQQLGLVGQPPANPTPEQLQAQQQFRQALAEAQQRLEMMRLSELEQFRLTVKPLAQRIATGMGFSLVMELRDNVLSVDPSADITNDIIAAMPAPPGNTPGPLPGAMPGGPQGNQGTLPGGMLPVVPAQPQTPVQPTAPPQP